MKNQLFDYHYYDIVVDGVAITSTKGTTQNVSGYNNPTFTDTSKHTFNVEVKYDGAYDAGWKYAEVYFPPEDQAINEGGDSIALNISGNCYGTITRITSFTSGTAIG